jgi:hypothetical protein
MSAGLICVWCYRSYMFADLIYPLLLFKPRPYMSASFIKFCENRMTAAMSPHTFDIICRVVSSPLSSA